MTFCRAILPSLAFLFVAPLAIGAPPALGADTDRLLGEMLGYPAEKIEQLRKEKAI